MNKSAMFSFPGSPLPTLLGFLLISWFVLALLAQQNDHANHLSDFREVWVRRIDQHVFVVLHLELRGGEIVGTLTRPRHYNDVSGEGSTVTDPAPVVLPVENVTLLKGELHFTTPDPSGQGKPDESTMSLWDSQNARLAYANFTFMPRWLLTKSSERDPPPLSTNWPSQKEQIFSPEVKAVQDQLHFMVEKDQATDAPPYTPEKSAHFKKVCDENYPIIAELFKVRMA